MEKIIAEYKNHLDALRIWTSNVSQDLTLSGQAYITPDQPNLICNSLKFVADTIKEDYPFYAKSLNNISDILFIPTSSISIYAVNPTAFGELYIILQQLYHEPLNTAFFMNVHPKIRDVSLTPYLNCLYSDAAEDAIKKVETRLREKFAELEHDIGIPSSASDIIGRLLGKNGTFQFVDASTRSGENYCRGVKLLFEGAFAAYRNPSAHANVECSKREAVEQIMLASQLMYILDLPNLSNQKE